MSSQGQEVQAETVIRALRRALDEANFQNAVLQAQIEELTNA